MNKSQTEIKLKPQYNPTISGFKNFVIAYNRGIQDGKKINEDIVIESKEAFDNLYKSCLEEREQIERNAKEEGKLQEQKRILEIIENRFREMKALRNIALSKDWQGYDNMIIELNKLKAKI